MGVEQKELPKQPTEHNMAWQNISPASQEYGAMTDITSPTDHRYDAAPRYELDGPSLGEMDGGWRGTEMRG